MSTHSELFTRTALRDLAPVFSHRFRVRFQDTDPAGIVFFARNFDYFHDAFAEYLRHAGMSLESILAERLWMAPLTHCEADFSKPLRFGDMAEVGLVRARIEGGRLMLGYVTRRMTDEGVGETAVTGLSVHTFVNAKTFERISTPEQAQGAFAELLKR